MLQTCKIFAQTSGTILRLVCGCVHAENCMLHQRPLLHGNCRLPTNSNICSFSPTAIYLLHIPVIRALLSSFAI